MNDPYEEYRDPRGCGRSFIVMALIAASLLFLLFCAVGCKCPECVTATETEKLIKVVERDTTIITKADSASIKAVLRCDSAYNVVLDELETLQGERIKGNVSTQKHGKDLSLLMNCKEDSLSLEIQLRDSIIETLQKNTTTIREKYVPAYYKNVSTGFWILLVILLGIVAFKVYKIYIKIQSGGIL